MEKKKLMVEKVNIACTLVNIKTKILFLKNNWALKYHDQTLVSKNK
jgi:hypothetical protein